MVITCPNCQAKYKLPGKRLEGRGAKITCPRCSHVFVIFNKERQDSGQHAAVSVDTDALQPASRRVTPPGPTRASQSGEVSAPVGAQLPGGLRAEDIFSTDYAAEAAEEDEQEARSPSSFEPPSFGVSRDRPRPEEVPSGPQQLFDDHVSGSDPAEEVQPAPAPGGTPSETLDFKAVGVTTWKVKVAIGLTYDFADIATLRRSIRNGKVTAEDQISHDGKAWDRIGEDPELEVYLQRTFEALQAAEGIVEADVGKPPAREPAADEPGTDEAAADAPPAMAQTTTSASELAAINRAALNEAAGGDALKVDLKPRRRRRKRKEKAEKKPVLQRRNPLLLGIAVCLAILLVFVVVRGAMKNDGDGRTRSSISDEELEQIREDERKKIQKQLEDQTREILGAENENGGEADVAVEPIPAPLPPDDRADPVTPASDAAAREEREREREERREREKERAREREKERERETTPAPDGDGSTDAGTTTDAGTSDDGGGEAVEVEETTAEDWAFLGDGALKNGNCSGAISNFREAVGKSPGNANYNYKLGLSYHRCGKDDSAVRYLKKAAGSVPAASELLEQIEGGGGE